MRFVIYGAGAVGGVVGAQLHKAGEKVVLIARGAHLDAIRSDGLRCETPHEKVTLPISAVAHPRKLGTGSDDVVILTMKTQHTLSALEDLREVAGDQVPVVCCQNGVANEHIALRRFQNVYEMLVYLPAQMTQPGVIQTHMATKSGVLDLCRFPGAVDERCSEIARRLSSANFSSRPNPEVMRFKYEKLLMNLRNALGAICANGSEQDAVYQQMRREAEACYTAAGIDWASEDEVKELRRDTIVRGKIEGVEEVGNSTFQSLLRQTGDAESDFLNGEICLLGRRHSVLTPAHHVVQRLSNDLARRRGRPQSISVEEVGRLIKMGEA